MPASCSRLSANNFKQSDLRFGRDKGKEKKKETTEPPPKSPSPGDGQSSYIVRTHARARVRLSPSRAHPSPVYISVSLALGRSLTHRHVKVTLTNALCNYSRLSLSLFRRGCMSCVNANFGKEMRVYSRRLVVKGRGRSRVGVPQVSCWSLLFKIVCVLRRISKTGFFELYKCAAIDRSLFHFVKLCN